MNRNFLNNSQGIRYLNVILFLLFLILPILLYRDVLFGNNVMISGDGIYYLISKQFLKQGFSSGEIPLWNMFLATGIPNMADMQNAFFYPFNIFLPFMDISTYTNYFYLLHLSFAAFFMYLYLNEIQDSKIVSFITAIIFAFSSIIGGVRKEHINIVATIIWLPLVLYFIERFRNSDNKKFIIFSAVTMAIQFFAGFPQTAIYSDIIVFTYLLDILFTKELNYKSIFKILILWISVYIMLIAIQLIPLLEQMSYSGRNSIPYEYFSVLSYDWRILPMTIFPELYWNIYEPLGDYASSGIDIEIYFGAICCMYVLYLVPYSLKDKRIRFLFLLLIGTFIYGAAGNIPILGKILWKIPILGSFRVQSRVMFIFVFFCIVLFALALSKIREKTELTKLIKFNIIFITLVTILRIVLSLLISNKVLEATVFSQYGIDSINYWIPIITLVLNAILLIIFYNIHVIYSRRKYIYAIMCIAICIITLVDVGRFSIKHNVFSIEETLAIVNNPELEILKKEESSIYRSWGIIADMASFNDEKFKIGKLNRNVITNNMFINAFNTFHDPRLTKLLGDFVYPDANNMLQNRNDLISMLSIKYIFDPWDIINIEYINGIQTLGYVFNLEKIVIPNNNNKLSVITYPINIERNKSYKIEFDLDIAEVPELFYLDFYGNNYDNPVQDIHFDTYNGKRTYSAIVSTGAEKLPENVVIRIVSKANYEMKITNLTVGTLERIPFETDYEPKLGPDGTIVYRNKNVQPILYTPDQIIGILDSKDLYTNPSYRNMDKVNYIEGFKNIDLKNVTTEMTNIEIKNNKILAVVEASDDTFINHSQSMYPSWKAYVDGNRTPIYLVNGIIQGIEVPKGKHVIEFVFKPNSLILGSIVTLGGSLFIAIYLFRKKKELEYTTGR